jgi:hypothetical protein
MYTPGQKDVDPSICSQHNNSRSTFLGVNKERERDPNKKFFL